MPSSYHRLLLSLQRATGDPNQEPAYRQIANQIRQFIATGALSPGDHLPTVRALAQELGCTPGTVARAYKDLEREGLVVGARGGGTSVTQPRSGGDPLRQARLLHRLEQPLLEALAAGYSPAEVSAAFTLALANWRQQYNPTPAPDPTTAPDPERLRFVGSHDLAIELLGAHLRRARPTLDLALEYAGSLGGLIALARGEADLAGAHLRDMGDDDYNLDYVRHILPGQPVALVTLGARLLGLMVAPGNPRHIVNLDDLGRTDVAVINRQPGSGTRVWFDRRLRDLGIEPQAVPGYDRETNTHLGVAQAVLAGEADAGPGVYAAARATGLDFVPLERERYDLVLLATRLDQPAMQTLLDVLRGLAFRDEVAVLGGYDMSLTGQVRIVN